MKEFSKEPGERTDNENEVLSETEAFIANDPRYEMSIRESETSAIRWSTGSWNNNGNPDYLA